MFTRLASKQIQRFISCSNYKSLSTYFSIIMIANSCFAIVFLGDNEETATFWTCLQEIQDGMEVLFENC